MIIIHFLIAIIATMSFAVLFQAPKKELIFCGFTGGLSWLIYEVMTTLEYSPVIASFVATFFLMFFARTFAVIRKMPITVYLLSGIFPLVPGAGIYYTAYYMFQKESARFLAKGLETFEIACAIVFGIIFGFSVPQKFFQKLFQR